MTKRKKQAAMVDPYPFVVETYIPPGWELARMAAHHENPGAFNGTIKIDRYRVTAERIYEPVEVLQERLRELWRTTEHNIHLTTAFHAAAERLGIVLDHAERATKAKKS